MFKKKKKRYSEKTKAAAGDWLKQYGRTLEGLTDDQQKAVLDHVGRFRMRKWLWFYLVAGIISISIGIYGYFFSLGYIRFLLEWSAGGGLEEADIPLATNTAYLASALTFGYFLAGLFCFFAVWVNLYHWSRNRKIIIAFLHDNHS